LFLLWSCVWGGGGGGGGGGVVFWGGGGGGGVGACVRMYVQSNGARTHVG